MKQTIGQYLYFKPEDYPLTLEFDEFYYYETLEHNTLFYKPTAKVVHDFMFEEKLMPALRKEFGVKLFHLEICDFHGKQVFRATCDKDGKDTSEFRRYGHGSDVMLGYVSVNFTMDYDVALLGSIIEKDKMKPLEELHLSYTVNKPISEFIREPEETARPPT